MNYDKVRKMLDTFAAILVVTIITIFGVHLFLALIEHRPTSPKPTGKVIEGKYKLISDQPTGKPVSP